MTRLEKPVKRLSSSMIREQGQMRPIVVILHPQGTIGFRAKGYRREYQLPVDYCYRQAVAAKVADDKRAKMQARKERRAGK